MTQTADTFRRAQAESVVDMLLSSTMVISDREKQREYLITLAEAALAKAAPVSDVGASVERLREGVRAVTTNEFETDLYDIDDAETVMAQAADALLSAQEESVKVDASWRETLRQERDCRLNEVRLKERAQNAATRAESKLADAVGVLEKAKAYHDADHGMNGFTSDYEILRSEIDEALTSIKETGQ